MKTISTHIIPIAALSLAFAASAFSQTDGSVLPEDLAALKTAFEKATDQATDPITKRYVDSLYTLKGKYTQSGNLEGAVATDRAIKAVSNPSIGEDQPNEAFTELDALRTKYEAARTEALQPLTRKYLEALDPVKLKYTQMGKLESALAVDKEIKAQQASIDASAKQAPKATIDVAKLADLKWRIPEQILSTDTERQWIQFAPNGRLVCGWNQANFNWKVGDDGNILFYPFKNRQKAVNFAWDNESPIAIISDDKGTHKVTQYRR